MATIFIGTELKLNINIAPIDSMTMDDYDFEVEVWTSSQKMMRIAKENTIKVDENNRIILVDTNLLGAGDMKYKVTAYLPDGDFPDRVRTEIVAMETGIKIIKTL